MQIVIDIPDRQYELLQRVAKTKRGMENLSEYGELILNGTPLPKGHGRIGDLDAVMSDISTSIDAMTNLGIAVEGDYLWAKLNDAIYNAPTIIEANTESEG